MIISGVTGLFNTIPTKQYEFPRPSNYLSFPDVMGIQQKAFNTFSKYKNILSLEPIYVYVYIYIYIYHVYNENILITSFERTRNFRYLKGGNTLVNGKVKKKQTINWKGRYVTHVTAGKTQCAVNKRETLQHLQVPQIRNLLQYTITATVKANI